MPIMAKSNDEYTEVKAIKTPDGTEIDYVLSKVDNTYKRTYTATRELEDTPPLEFKSIKPNANLTNYRIYGQTVDGESVGDRTGNLFYKKIENANISSAGGIYSDNYDLWIGKVTAGETYTAYNTNSVVGFFTDEPKYGRYTYNSSRIVDAATVYTFTVPSDCSYVAIRFLKNTTYAMLNEGATPLPYEPYGYKVSVTIEGKNLWSGVVEQGGVSIDGTYSDSAKRVRFKNVPIEPGSYTISANLTIRLVYAYNGNDRIGRCVNTLEDRPSWTFTVPAGANNISIGLMKYVDGVEVDITPSDFIWGQIEKGSEATTYEPYRTPVTTPIYLPEQIKKVGDEAEYIDYGEQKQHRVRKNLLQNTAMSRTMNGVTFTVNSDGSVTCNGTARDTARINVSAEPSIFNDVILTGCPVGGDWLTFQLDILSSYNIMYRDVGSGVRVDTGNEEVYCRIRIASGYTCNNLTFYPMIRKADIEDDTYEPYIENTDLDVTLPALPTVTGTNVLSVGTEVQPSDMYIKGNFKMIAGGGE